MRNKRFISAVRRYINMLLKRGVCNSALFCLSVLYNH
nr:MAG TPA: PPa-CH3 miniprotein CH-pi interactions weak [Caudoviricetes sp.]